VELLDHRDPLEKPEKTAPRDRRDGEEKGVLKDMAKQLHYVDRSIDNIYREMGTHITRMTELQRELDSLRNKVRQLAAVR
jgi:hypothetical protein